MKEAKKSPIHWFAERTSMHGIPSLIKSSTTSGKAFWSLVCIAGISMFTFMLILLIRQYLSYPVVVKIEEVPKGLVVPKITFCNKRFTGLLNEIATETMIREGMDSQTLEKFSYRNATQDFYQLLHSLQKLKQNLNKYGLSSENRSLHSDTNKTLLNRWHQVRYDLTNTWLISTLLLDASDVDSKQTVRLKQLQYFSDVTTINCQRRKLKCNESYYTPFLTVSHTGCKTYDLREGSDVDESRIQGINNGVTFIFMTGSKISAIEFDKNRILNLPGFQNTFEASSGSEGIRMIIHDPDTSLWPEHEGIDVSPGFSTIIGINSKEKIRLKPPYSDCTEHNKEIEMLLHSITSRLGYSPKREDGNLHESLYTTLECRSSCLQRHIWESCNCLLLGEYLPFFNSSFLCGHMAKETNILHNPKAYEKEHCFDLQNMTDLECTNFLSKLFSDLSCVQKVLRRASNEITDLKCNCPSPCCSKEYPLTIGTSYWPSPGPELDAAYTSIVRGIVIPDFRRKQTTLLNRTIHYFENETNKNEIMTNFARVTVYIRSLKVERSEQIAAYTILDLISDIGGHLGLWIGISAVTIFEVIGFLILTFQKHCMCRHLQINVGDSSA